MVWLRANLDLCARKIDGGEPADRAEVRKALGPWRTDADLAGIRDPDALAHLPGEEREECRKLWTDFAALLKRAQP